ncbi:MAG: hypothetical protein WA323_20295, partial [Candidatus Nitrosopolaris sp.]
EQYNDHLSNISKIKLQVTLFSLSVFEREGIYFLKYIIYKIKSIGTGRVVFQIVLMYLPIRVRI